MVVPPLIERKRDGGSLRDDEWRGIIDAYANGSLPDYQMAALAMAVYFRGLDPDELSALTDSMLASGDRMDFSDENRPVIDKHSTGGVGDKTSLLLAPMLAACGAVVPMMSGRGLGHTGGTLDKLEAIPGFRTDLKLDRAVRQAREIGLVMLGQTAEIAPADRKLYALRDVTATVESIPLIAASIMSKKLAEGLDGLVLDVKHGSGAFLPESARALELARTMIGLGRTRGCPVVALVTAMDRPLGIACGNALEMREAIAGLSGDGPPDLMEVTMALGIEMLRLSGLAVNDGTARSMLERAIRSGDALERLAMMVAAQGGNADVATRPDMLPSADTIIDVNAVDGGTVTAVAPRPLGRVIVELGGGRRTVDDMVRPEVGLEVLVKPGQMVAAGDLIARVHARSAIDAERARSEVGAAITIGDDAPVVLPLIGWRVTHEHTTPWEG
ncbi:MAG: thymidine phosphorylase [Gemmatimonadales bacterium]|nr:thymidine phosphorylase [Gemmatimonadales bacterium]